MSEKKLNPSFVKSLFSGFILDELVFPYPLIDKEEEENLNLILDSIRKFCENYVDSAKFDREEKFPDDVINGMKELGLFGLRKRVKVGTSGNALDIKLSKSFVDFFNIKKGQEVEIEPVNKNRFEVEVL